MPFGPVLFWTINHLEATTALFRNPSLKNSAVKIPQINYDSLKIRKLNNVNKRLSPKTLSFTKGMAFIWDNPK
jgi:hypothetical protein